MHGHVESAYTAAVACLSRLATREKVSFEKGLWLVSSRFCNTCPACTAEMDYISRTGELCKAKGSQEGQLLDIMSMLSQSLCTEAHDLLLQGYTWRPQLTLLCPISAALM